MLASSLLRPRSLLKRTEAAQTYSSGYRQYRKGGLEAALSKCNESKVLSCRLRGITHLRVCYPLTRDAICTGPEQQN